MNTPLFWIECAIIACIAAIVGTVLCPAGLSLFEQCVFGACMGAFIGWVFAMIARSTKQQKK